MRLTAHGVLRDLWQRPKGRAGLVVLAVIVLLSLAGPAFVQDPAAIPDLEHGRFLAPGAAHFFGTDYVGRDVLARVIWGSRISLGVSALSVLLAMTAGTAVGLVAGYLGGWADAAIMRFVDAALAVPRLFLLLLLVAVWEHIPLVALIIVIGATGWFGTARMVRGEVLRLREQDYVRAAEALGGRRRRIIFHHLLPNTLGPVVVTATLAIGDVILVEAGLSFLGLGVQPPTASWGSMIQDAKSTLFTAPWTGAFPGLAIVLTVLAVNLVGEALQDSLTHSPA
ncbi:MAG: ABC transporter permease [Gemmatimonadota bacterium]